MAIKIDYTGDPREFLAATGKTTEALDTTAAKLDEVKQTADDTSDAMTQSAEGAADSTRDVGDAAGDAAGDLGRLGTAGSQALRGDVAGAAESALSAIESLGPVGTLAGAVAGAGIGFITQQLQEQQKAAQQAERDLISMYSNAAKEGRDFLTEAQIEAAALDIMFDTDKRNNAKQEAEQIGVDVTTYIRAQAGDQQALNYVIDKTTEALQHAANTGATLREVLQLQDILTENQKLGQIHEDNAEAAQQYADIVAQGNAEQQAAIQRTRDADQARYEGLAAQIAELNGQKVEIPTTFSVDKTPVEKYLADLRTRRIPIVADVVDRYGRVLDR